MSAAPITQQPARPSGGKLAQASGAKLRDALKALCVTKFERLALTRYIGNTRSHIKHRAGAVANPPPKKRRCAPSSSNLHQFCKFARTCLCQDSSLQTAFCASGLRYYNTLPYVDEFQGGVHQWIGLFLFFLQSRSKLALAPDLYAGRAEAAMVRRRQVAQQGHQAAIEAEWAQPLEQTAQAAQQPHTAAEPHTQQRWPAFRLAPAPQGAGNNDAATAVTPAPALQSTVQLPHGSAGQHTLTAQEVNAYTAMRQVRRCSDVERLTGPSHKQPSGLAAVSLMVTHC